MFRKIAQKLGYRVAPRDERIEAQLGKSYKVGFMIMFSLLLCDIYLQFIAIQYANSSGSYMLDLQIRPLELAAVFVSVLVMTLMQTHWGIFDRNPIYNETPTFPWGYCCSVSGLIALAVLLLTAGGRMYQEIVHVGWEHVTWIGDVAMGFVFAVEAFCIALFVCYLMWRSARRHQTQDDEDE